MSRASWRLVAACAFGCTFGCAFGCTFGCGTALVEEGYRGEPLLAFDGVIRDFRFVRELENLRASVFWSRDGRSSIAVEDLVEQPRVSVETMFPSHFRMNLFNAPVLASNGAFIAGEI